MERIKLNIQKFADSEIEIKFKTAMDATIAALKQGKKEIDFFKAGVNATSAGINKFVSNVNKLNHAFNSLNLRGISRQISGLGRSLYNDFLTKAIDTSEELNLFNVVFNNMEKDGKKTFSELGKQAIRFQNDLNERFGTNMKETMRYQGLFQAMGESAGLDDKTAALMSTNLTKLTYDLSSLYNTSEVKAAESLRAGVYAGMTKPLRNYGIDITQNSFKPLMEELGLDKSVSELTQAEKEILRYVSTLRQAKNAMVDFANTIESPANQLKVLKQQFYEMQTAIGSLFIGAFARILPYVNGIIMVIKALARAIASFFGIEMKDYNLGLASYADDLNDYSESLDGVGDSANGAGNSIKALKRQVLAFDQINNLTTPTPSSGSGGGAGGGSLGEIDDKLLAALEEYDNGMELVRMRAVDIRDTIMEWLGFTKQIDDETHEVSFTYDTVGKKIDQIAKEIATNLGNMLNYYTNKIDWSKMGEYLALGLNTAFGFIDTFIQTYGWRNLGNKIAEFINKAIKDIDAETIGRVLTDKMRVAILSLLGFIEKFDFEKFGSKLADLINSAIKNIPIQKLAEGLNKLVDGVWTSIKELVKQIDWGSLIDTVVTFFKELDWGAKLLVLAPVIASALGALFGAQVVQEAIGQMIIKAIMSKITSGSISGSLGAGASAGGGSIIGGVGTAGATVIGAYLQIKGYETTNEAIDNLFSGKPIDLKWGMSEDKGFWENLFTGGTNALGTLSFLNPVMGNFAGVMGLGKLFGSVKENGLGGTLETLFGSVESTLGLDKGKLYDVYVKPFQKIIDTVDGANKALFGFGKTTYKVSDDIKKNAKTYFDTLVETDKQQRIMKAATEGNYEEIKRIIEETTEESTEHVKNSLIEQTKAVEGDLGNELLNQWSILAYSSKDKYKEGIKDLPTDLQTKIQEATGVVVVATPEMAQKFADLSQTSEEEFMEKFNQLPKDIQDELLPLILEKGGKIPPELQKGIDGQPNPEVEVDSEEARKIQAKLNAQIKQVSPNSIPIGVNPPSRWSLQNTINNLLSGINGFVSLSFGGGSGGGGFRANGGVFANGRWSPIQAYANGGVPSGGQLFMAREAGPELVGKIGRHTAVMNNNQIVDSVKAGVYEAVSAAMSEGGMGSVQIDLHTDEGVVVDRINRITRQTGNCPIEI